ncbi:hypothetical protein DENSPDRAFT_876053 [Dentipellis sp. KUC8613]|nr:hypothetical protein DENSPDRAFT_876053 [Dentipellis sp. KUC8613]
MNQYLPLAGPLLTSAFKSCPWPRTEVVLGQGQALSLMLLIFSGVLGQGQAFWNFYKSHVPSPFLQGQGQTILIPLPHGLWSLAKDNKHLVSSTFAGLERFIITQEHQVKQVHTIRGVLRNSCEEKDKGTLPLHKVGFPLFAGLEVVPGHTCGVTREALKLNTSSTGGVSLNGIVRVRVQEVGRGDRMLSGLVDSGTCNCSAFVVCLSEARIENKPVVLAPWCAHQHADPVRESPCVNSFLPHNHAKHEIRVKALQISLPSFRTVSARMQQIAREPFTVYYTV